MASVVFSTWLGNVVDNRNVSGEPQEVAFKLPVAFDGERPLRAFMGWDGIILFDKDVDVPAMTAEYMKRVNFILLRQVHAWQEGHQGAHGPAPERGGRQGSRG